MNKDLDDRLLPPGEYRDAQNIQISKSEGSDVGVVQNVKGNTRAHSSLGLNSADIVIGNFFDEKNDRIIFFITDGANHSIRLYKTSDDSVSILCQGAFLNFSTSNLITGINLIEDLLFWTDYRNQPRMLNVETALASSSYYNSEDLISVAKFSPYEAATIDLSNEPTIKDDYIKEKFVRFSYRYKFKDNQFSTLAPFTQIAFELENQTLTSEQVFNAATTTFIKEMVNHANRVALTIPLPSNPFSHFNIIAVDIILKDSNSTAAKIVETIEVTSSTGTSLSYNYDSTIPIKTLPEDQITRVFDAVPLKAKAQEVSGNRVIYGNFTQNIAFNGSGVIGPDGTHPVIDYTVSIKDKSTAAGDINYEYLHHSLKQRRRYDVGIVLSDKWGRKSPVILSNSSSIYFEAKNDSFDSNDWLGSCLEVTFNTAIPNQYDALTNPHGWYSWRVVVKQNETDYYNVYIPGAAKFSNDGYISLHGDNVNKVPRSSDFNAETELNPSKTKLYPKVINRSSFTNINSVFGSTRERPLVNKDGTIDAKRYTVKNNTNPAASITDGITGIVFPYVFYGEVGENPVDYSRAKVTTTSAIINTNVTLLGPYVAQGIRAIDGSAFAPQDIPNQVTAAIVYVNGDHQIETSISGAPVAPAIGGVGNGNATIEITFGTALNAGDKVDILLEYKSDLAASEDTYVDSLVAPISNDANIQKGEGAEFDQEIFALNKVLLKSSDFDDIMKLAKANHDVIELDQALSDGDLFEVTDIAAVKVFGDFTEEVKGGDGIGLYDSNNNPLLARLSNNKTTGGTGEIPFINFSSVVNDLAVFETKPVESALDIYYETSTSGLVTELNNEINAVEFTCVNANFVLSDGTTGNTILGGNYTVSAGTVTSISPTTYTSGSDTYTATITAPAGYSNSGQSITCTDVASGSTAQTEFGCSDASFTVSNGAVGTAVNYSVAAGTVTAVTPSTYQSGTNVQYTATITVPSGYTNAGNTLTTCFDTATGTNPVQFQCGNAGLTVNNGIVGQTVTGTVTDGTITGSFTPSTYVSGPSNYSVQITVPNDSSLWTNAGNQISCSGSATGSTSSTPNGLFGCSDAGYYVNNGTTGSAVTGGLSQGTFTGGFSPATYVQGTYNAYGRGIIAPAQFVRSGVTYNSTNSGATITCFDSAVGTAAQQDFISASPTSLSFGPNVQALSFTISQSGTGAVTANGTPSWITVNPTGYDTSLPSTYQSGITFTTQSNSSSASRSGSITYTKVNGGTATISFTQAGVTESLTLGSLTQFTPTNPPAQTLTISQSGPSTPTVTDKPSWITLSPSTLTTSTTSVSVTASNHTASGTRSGQIQITKGSTVRSITVSQAGSSAATSGSLSPDPITAFTPGQSGSTTVSVTANGTWEISFNSAKYSASPSSGSGNGSVTVSYNGTSVTKNGEMRLHPAANTATNLDLATIDMGF